MEGLIVILVLISFAFGYAVGYIAGRPPPCRHSTRTTTFYGLDDLRDMMSGKITVDEWKDRPDLKTVTKCCDCGEIL